MTLRIVLTQIVAGEALKSEREFEQTAVTFGRASDNALQIQDADKQVSSHHGRIEIRDGGCWVTDLGSLNGTQLNGAPLEPNTPMPVRAGDVVSVGAFRIEPVLRDAGQKIESTIVRLDPKRIAQKLGAKLEARYAELADLPQVQRMAALRREVEGMVGNLDPEQARAALAAIGERFRGGAVAGGGATADESEQTLQAGFRVLQDLAKHFVPSARFQSSADVGRFGRMLRQALELAFDWLAKGLEGRRKFDDEIGADVTMVFGLDANPVKGGKNADEIGSFVLDWTTGKTASEIAANLEGAFRDLNLHQLGLLRGAQYAVDAALGRLAPELIEQRAAQKGKGFLGIGSGAREWEEFKAAHRELHGSRERLFEQLVAPSVRQAVRECFEQQLKEGAKGSGPKK